MGQVPAYKAQAWLTRANHLQKHNDSLAGHLEVVSQQLLAAQQAQAHAELSLQHFMQAQVGNPSLGKWGKKAKYNPQ